MKHLLLLIGLLIGTLLFASGNETDGSRQQTADARETVMKEKNSATDIHYRIEALGNELKDNKGLAPRRVFQPTGQSFQARLQQSFDKLSQALRQRSQGTIYKTSEEWSLGLTVHLSTLFCRDGHHVFALRKLII